MNHEPTEELESIIQSLRVQAESWENYGIQTLPKGKTVLEKSVSFEPEQTLDNLNARVKQCVLCQELASKRTQVVFGTGNPSAELVFVGEAPGFDEDKQGEPFVGKAGQLLTRIILAMGYAREDVYICNVLKCRPPNNRNPLPDEVKRCEPYLKQQLALLKPKILVALGKFAAQTLLQSEIPISRLRGNWKSYEGIPLMPTFHPAYLLRNEQDKRLVWDDMKQVMERLGRNPKS